MDATILFLISFNG